ncbi:Putative uncharacterized protein (plasmid) [Lactococcus lactis subsp. lactis]|nr:Putative uncharacterized protein [Lactococcus lactis subsp. lactis]
MKFVLSELQTSKERFILMSKVVNTLLLMRSRKKRKRHLKIKRKLLGIDAVSI